MRDTNPWTHDVSLSRLADADVMVAGTGPYFWTAFGKIRGRPVRIRSGTAWTRPGLVFALWRIGRKHRSPR